MPLQIASDRSKVVWNGSFFVHHSLALVNRELTLALLNLPAFASRFQLSVGEVGARSFDPAVTGRMAPLAERAHSVAANPSVTARHAWPPDFRRPATGSLVLCQPWEFGSLPTEWIAQIDRSVDEVWAYTEHVRQTYVDSGVSPSKVHVVPLGIDPERFHTGVTPFDFQSHPATRSVLDDDYKFLFVGGTIPRKGIDVLLDAYDRAFRATDPVTLIIKDFGTDSFYANQGAGLLIRALQAKPGGARIVYLTEEMSEAEIASLYAACDCLVHPYRGEGYGLPIAEAMACGKPVIATGMGAALDFANSENAYLIPASRQYLEQGEIGGLKTVSQPHWHEPDREALRELLERVVNAPAKARIVGQRAAADMASKHTWAHAAARAAERIVEVSAAQGTTTSYSLPMGLSNFGLCALNGVDLPPELKEARYEDRKQTALSETRHSDWGDAVQHLEACLAEQPDDWDTVNALAVARFRLGDTDEAIRLLRRGVREAGQTRDFHHNLAFILLERGREEEALEALEHAELAFRCSPESAELARTLQRARSWALRAARGMLRSAPGRQRAQARRDDRYKRLMDAYHRAELALTGEERSIAVVSSAPVKAARISLVMIVRNEERFLRGCLQSARELVDEIVIVDTGSTDATPEIAREFGAVLVSHVWKDDFSEARNVALRHATGDWALWLDADEEIAPESVADFRAAVESASAWTGGFMVKFRNWLQSTVRRDDTDVAIHHACRLFRLVPGVAFEGRIHEQNLRSLQNLGYEYAYQPGLVIDHFGYAEEVMTSRNKHERFIRMLTREVEECPDPSLRHFHLFNLGNAYFTLGDMENAARYLAQACEQPDLKEEFTASMFTELITALHRLGRADDGLRVSVEADRLGVQQSGVEFARGYCLLHLLRYAEAEQTFRKAMRLGASASPYAQTGDQGTSGYKARYGLALALVGQERYAEARSECLAAVRAQPGFVEARYLLAVTCMRLAQPEEAKYALEALLELVPDFVDAQRDLGNLLFERGEYLAAQGHLERAVEADGGDSETAQRLAVCYASNQDVTALRSLYERMRAAAPDSPELCVNLGRVLAESGDSAEALECFTEAIALDPRHSNAYFNAGDLLYRMEQFQDAANIYMAGLQINPQQPSGFFVLGNCFYHTRDFDAAVVSYRQELVHNPEHSEAIHNLELVEAMRATEEAAA